jgi:GDSL-like Lipase/Acylhydrolase family
MGHRRRPRARASSIVALALAVVALAAAPRLPVAAAGTLPYAALGDSYSAGIGSGAEDGTQCRRSANAYPPVLSASSGRYVLTDFAACSGAMIADVSSVQLAGIGGARLVTITVGGNDAGFGPIIIDCLRPGSGCRRDFPDEDARIDALAGPLHDLYLHIVAAAPGAGLDVLTYPQIFRAQQSTCPSTLDFTPDDIAWFRSEYTHMNAVVRRAAAGVPRTRVVDVETAFGGHEVCSAQPWAFGARISDPYSSFHPNALGHAALAALLREVTG